MTHTLAVTHNDTISEIQRAYSNYSYDELVHAQQCGLISMIDFIVAQKDQFEEFKIFLSDKGLTYFSDVEVRSFLEKYENSLMDYMQED